MLHQHTISLLVENENKSASIAFKFLRNLALTDEHKDLVWDILSTGCLQDLKKFISEPFDPQASTEAIFGILSIVTVSLYLLVRIEKLLAQTK